jgi:hypothetical protein
MMRHFSLCTVAFVLVFAGTAFAQSTLVRHDDQNDPCRRFKMRILVPANGVDHELPLKRFAGGIDSGMVWDPCAAGPQQIAVVPLIQEFKSNPLFPQPETPDKQRAPAAFLLAPPRFRFPRIWRRP